MAVDLLLLANAGMKGLEAYGKSLEYKSLATSYNVNAGLLEMDSKLTMADAGYRIRRMEENGMDFVASQSAAYAKAGVTFEGSVTHVIGDTIRKIRMDVMTAGSNAAREANRQGFQAVNQKLAAGAAKVKSSQALTSGVLDMAYTYGKAKYGGD